MFDIRHGDCREVLKQLPDCSVDSIVTDPPYELGFMGKSWDSTGVAYDVEVWRECLRVLKVGGHLLAFGGSRTYHRLAVAIEDSGFQIRDQIMWVYGSGFPKSLNIGKAIDKAAGAPVKVGKAFKVAGEYGHRDLRDPEAQGFSRDEMRHSAVTAEAKQWEGWGTALKPAHEPIVMARKPLDGTVANNVLTHGVGGINIDASRVSMSEEDFAKLSAGVEAIRKRGGTMENSWKNSSDLSGANPANAQGRFPANFIHDGSDEVLELFPDSKSSKTKTSDDRINHNKSMFVDGVHNAENSYDDSGSAARFFYCAKASKKDRNEGLDGFEERWKAAAEFRPNHMEKALEGESENPFGRFQPTQNHHPTVKPTDLMQYLVRLVTPSNGTVLDPFTGSGSTGKAATLEGFNFIGIEQSAEYVEIATARINHAEQ
jgi:DNA modification methylase